jgi:solute carrier family 12 sodium/potassium/chloride transporter 2
MLLKKKKKTGDPPAQGRNPGKKERAGYQFGTLTGVFTPNILTILGVVMYLRFGWVLGNVGLIPTLIIVTISTAITFLTALSVSALATNMKVQGGGAYFMISRSLGIETGAAIGLPLFLAQALGISFYVVGFSESVVQIAPLLDMRTVGTFTLFVLFLIAFRSADFALKTQYIIMLFIGLSLISFFMGTGERLLPVTQETAVPDKEHFWVVFAVFFPAVTGILSGLSMSGDLRNPGKAIPWGTLGAVAFSYAIYMAIPIFFVRVVQDTRILLIDSMIMYRIARWGQFILAGLWGAALSSALSSLLAAPRTLQAIAKDGIVFRFIGKGFGKNQDPWIAMLITLILALGGTVAGDLNMIAPVLSMFFLTTYGLLNLSAGFGRLINSPSWRPKFRVHWGFCFIGAFGCFAVMFMINAGATFIALFISVAVYALMKRRRLRARWGDMKSGILMLLVQFSLLKLSAKKPNVETWRPNILVLSGSPKARWHLIELADAISHGYGLLTVVSVLPEKHITSEREENLERAIKSYLEERKIRAFVKVYPAHDLIGGITSLVRGYGFGPIEPNTIILGEIEEGQNFSAFAGLIKMMHEDRRNVIIVKEGDAQRELQKERSIDVWWEQKGKNAGLILALAHLLKTSPSWLNAKLVLKTVTDSPTESPDVERGLRQFIEQGRIDAEIKTVPIWESGVFDTIAMNSRDADFVFIGLRPPDIQETAETYGVYIRDIMQKTQKIPLAAYVLSSEDMEFRKLFSSLEAS